MNDPGRCISRKSPSLYIVFVPKLTKRAYTCMPPSPRREFHGIARRTCAILTSRNGWLWSDSLAAAPASRRLHAGAGTAFPCRYPPRSPDNLLGRDVPAKLFHHVAVAREFRQRSIDLRRRFESQVHEEYVLPGHSRHRTRLDLRQVD